MFHCSKLWTNGAISSIELSVPSSAAGKAVHETKHLISKKLITHVLALNAILSRYF